MSRLSLAAFIALATIALQAQDPSSSRSSAGDVRLDMYASVDGKNLDDLTAEEIEVLEDGVPQKVDRVEHVVAGTSARPRVFVVFLDTYHTAIEASANLRLPLVRFLDRLVGADDLVALVTPEVGEIALGRKSVVISNIMQAEWTWARRDASGVDQKETLFEACYGGRQSNIAAEMIARRREQLALDALENVMGRLSGARDERKALVVVSDGWQLFRPNPGLTSADRTRGPQPGDVLRRTPRRTPAEGDGATGVNRVECDADRVALSKLDHTQRLREMSDEANRATVTFYSLYARGLAGADPAGGANPPRVVDDGSARVRQDSLRFLADNTDGTAVLAASAIDSGLERIVSDLSSYYLLGYTSANTKLDGRFRNITVRVKRAGARVRARRGYRGRTADELLSGPAATAASGAPASAAVAAPIADANARSQFRIRTSSWARQTDGHAPTGGFWVVGEIDYRTRRELAWTAGAKAEVTVLASDGNEIAARSLDVRTEDGPFGVQVPESGGLPPGEYAVRVRLTSGADTSLVLTDTARVVVGQRAALGEAVLWRRGPTTGLQHRRTADARFRRSDRLRLELATSVSGTSAARLLDRNGEPLNVPLQVAEREDASGDFTWVVVDATLAPLAPGDYAIEVTQGVGKQVTSFALVP